MTAISSSNPFQVDFSQIKKLDLPSSAVRKLSPEEIEKFEEIRKAAYSKPANLDELKNHVSQQVYAEVKINGKTVATLYNSGAASTSNAMGGKIQNLPSMGEDEKSIGPELAQKRAEEIAKALGGTITKASTAVTQAQYMATPAFKVEYKVDYEAMERDRRTAEGRVATAQTQVDTQSLAADDTQTASQSPTDFFMDFMDKSWEEKMRAMILHSIGETEESLAAMSPEDRAKIEEKILEKIKAEVEKKTGIPLKAA